MLSRFFSITTSALPSSLDHATVVSDAFIFSAASSHCARKFNASLLFDPPKYKILSKNSLASNCCDAVS